MFERYRLLDMGDSVSSLPEDSEEDSGRPGCLRLGGYFPSGGRRDREGLLVEWARRRGSWLERDEACGLKMNTALEPMRMMALMIVRSNKDKGG